MLVPLLPFNMSCYHTISKTPEAQLDLSQKNGQSLNKDALPREWSREMTSEADFILLPQRISPNIEYPSVSNGFQWFMIHFVHFVFLPRWSIWVFSIHPILWQTKATASLVPFLVVDSNASWRRSWTPTLCMEQGHVLQTAIFRDI